MKRLAIFGSTGSIGKQTLEVVAEHPSLFSVDVLSCHSQEALFLAQVEQWQPKAVFVTQPTAFEHIKTALFNQPVAVYGDWKTLSRYLGDVDFVVGAIGGSAGIEPTLIALELGLPVGLANKETLVAGGDLVRRKMNEKGSILLPVDSEHSAIFQCLQGQVAPEKLIITASGGPFRTRTEAFDQITIADALNHPNWQMGRKITVDSATLMNKGLEVIEAMHLFRMPIDDIQVVVHPESIVHSMVQFQDGSVLAQLGVPDMRLPIQYALSYPDRLADSFPHLDVLELTSLHFEKPRYDDFPALGLAFDAARAGKSLPCTLNAANEVAVAAFLEHRLRFVDIPVVVHETMTALPAQDIRDFADLQAIDQASRAKANEMVMRQVHP